MGQNGGKDDVGIRRKRTSNFPCYKSIVQRSAQKQRPWQIVDALLCRFGNDWDCSSHNPFCKSAQSWRSRRNVWSKITKLLTIERSNPLWEDYQVPHSCQTWSRQKCFLDCDDRNSMENELKSNHNKTNWANFLWMQEFWMLLKSDSNFMTKDTAEFSQFRAVACREYTLPREEEASQPKGWIQRNTKIGPVLEVATTCCLHGKYGVDQNCVSEQRQFSPVGQNISWIKQVCDEFEHQKSMRWNWMWRILQADQRPKKNHKEENLPALTREQYLLGKEFGPMLNQGNIHSPIMIFRRNWFIFFVMDNMCIEKMMEEFNSGELKIFFRNISCIVIIGLTTGGRKAWQEGETRKDSCTDCSGIILYLRVLQGHSGRSFIDPALQDSVVVPNNFFQYIYHVGCAVSVHSITNSGLTAGGQNLNNIDRQYSFCLWIPWTKIIRILIRSTWMNRVMHNTSIKHGRDIRTQCIGSKLLRKDWSSIRLDRTQSFFTRHFQLIVSRKLLWWNLEKSFSRKWKCHLGLFQRSPWNMIGKENWVQKMLHDQKDKLCNNSKVSNRTNQFQTQIMIEWCNPLLEPIEWGPVVGKNTRTAQSGRKTSRSQEIDTRSFHEEAVKHDRTGHPVVNRDESCHEQTMLNEVNMDFRIQWFTHSVVEQAESSRVRELVKKIDTHPDRHALQQDQQQNKAHNPFSARSKQKIQDAGNVELFELFETDTKNAVQSMLVILERRHRVLHMRASLVRNSGQSKFHCVYAGPSFNSRTRNQEGKTSWPQIWETFRKQRILSSPQFEKEMH